MKVLGQSGHAKPTGLADDFLRPEARAWRLVARRHLPVGHAVLQLGVEVLRDVARGGTAIVPAHATYI